MKHETTAQQGVAPDRRKIRLPVTFTLEDYYEGDMTKREIAVLSIKLLSIYAFLQAIDKSYDIIYFFVYKDQLHLGDKVNLIMTSAPPVLSGICGILLWCVAPLLATSIFKSTGPEYDSHASLRDIQMTAFSIVGIFILATGLPNLVNVVVIMLTSTSTEGGIRPVVHIIIVLVLKIALGLWLLLGSHRIVNFIRSMQRD